MAVEVNLPLPVTYRTRHRLWDAYRTVRRAGIAWSPSIGMWLLAGYEQIHSVLADPETFSSANTLPPAEMYPAGAQEILATLPPRPAVLINDVGEEHTLAKDVFNQGLVAARVKALRPRMKARINEQIDEFGVQVDLRTVAQSYVSTLVAALFGFPTQDADLVQAWLADHQTLWNPIASDIQKVEAARGLRDYHRYLSDLVADRMRGPRRDDLIGDLLAGHPDGRRMPLDKVVWMLTIAPIAATDTTRDTITSTVLSLLDQDLWEVARKDPHYAAKAIEETLRWLSPHCGLPRLVTRDVEVGGQHLADGEQILLLFGAANHDPRIHAAPEAFYPYRDFAHRHLAFGHGQRYCTGAPLARTEVRVALDALLSRLPRPHLPHDDWEFAPNPMFLGLLSLPVVTGNILPATLG